MSTTEDSLLAAKKECADLKRELDAVRLLLTEQSVMIASSGSAVKELKEELDRLKDLLKERESDLAVLNSELGRLNSELSMEKRYSAELKEKLAHEAALRKEMEKLLS